MAPTIPPVIPSGARNLRPKGVLVHHTGDACCRPQTWRRQRDRSAGFGKVNAASPRRLLALLEITTLSLEATDVWRPCDPADDRSPLLCPGRHTLLRLPGGPSLLVLPVRTAGVSRGRDADRPPAGAWPCHPRGGV